MIQRFESYHDAIAYAQRLANTSRGSVGIRRVREYDQDGFNVARIPAAGLRFGSDLTCEVVEPA